MTDTFRVFRSLTATALLVLLAQIAPALSQEKPRADGPPYRVGDGVTRPEILIQVKPVYTELARKSRVTGTVILETTIDEQGNVTDVRVLKGLPMGLSEAAVEAVQGWKFKPATREGRPVQVYYVLTVNFQVDNSGSDYGPLFTELLKKNPDFAAHLAARRYPEASQLLDRWAAERPADANVPLARIYLLLEQDQTQEALRKALDVQGPQGYEGLCRVGISAWRKSLDPDLDAESRVQAIDLGLQATTVAMAAQADGADAVLYKSWLLRNKAKLTNDPAERQALIVESDRLRKQATELQKAQATKTAPETGQDRPQ
jgi:TonB family protein